MLDETPKVIITFDDGKDNVYSLAYPILQANHQKAVFFVSSSKVDTAGYCSLAQLQILNSAGWDIANHSKTHVNLTAISEAQMHTEIDDCQNYLENNGFNSYKFLAYPYGNYNDSIVNYLTAQGYNAARTIIGGYNPLTLNLLMLSIMPKNTTTTVDVQGYIDYAIANRRLLVLTFHELVAAAPTEYQWLDSDFQIISDYIKTKVNAGDLRCVTMSEYYNNYFSRAKTAGQANIRGLSHG